MTMLMVDSDDDEVVYDDDDFEGSDEDEEEEEDDDDEYVEALSRPWADLDEEEQEAALALGWEEASWPRNTRAWAPTFDEMGELATISLASGLHSSQDASDTVVGRWSPT